jgi:hypothetical protein
MLMGSKFPFFGENPKSSFFVNPAFSPGVARALTKPTRPALRAWDEVRLR